MDFKNFLSEEAGLDEVTVQRLQDAGFDDMDSLELIGVP